MARVSTYAIVRNILLSRPFLKACLVEGVINYSSLARLIGREMEKAELKASHPAIKMALMRIREELLEREEELRKRVKYIIGNTVLQMHSDLLVITIKKDMAANVYGSLAKIAEGTRVFHLLQSTASITVIISKEDSRKVLELLEEGSIIDMLKDQAAISMLSPREIIETPGVIAFVVSSLYENNINITQIVSSYNDTIVIVNHKDAPEAFRVLENLIRSMRNPEKN